MRYGVLTLGSVTSGAVAPGELLSGSDIASSTTILSNSGNGRGSIWIVNNAQTIVGASASVLAPSLSVVNDFVRGATADRDYFDVSTAGAFDYDYLPSTMSYVGGTAAADLGLTQKSGALPHSSRRPSYLRRSRSSRGSSRAAAARSISPPRKASPARSTASIRSERTTKSRSRPHGSFPASRRMRGARREPWGSPTARAR